MRLLDSLRHLLGPLAGACVLFACAPTDSTFVDEDGDAEDSDEETQGDDAESETGEDDPPPEPACGDGVVDGDEECDDGNEVNDDGCSNVCVAPGGTIWWHDASNDDPHPSSGNALAWAPDGNIMLAGQSWDGLNADRFLGKFSPDGELIWGTVHEGGFKEDDYTADVAVDGDGASYVVGSGIRDDEGQDGWLGKFDENGELEWANWHSGPSHASDWGSGVALDGQGSVYYVGEEKVAFEGVNAFIRKLDSDGDEIWVRTYGAEGDQAANWVGHDDEGLLIVGNFSNDKDDDWDAWLARLDEDGELLWEVTWAGPLAEGWDFGSAAAVQDDGDILVVGASQTALSPMGWPVYDIWLAGFSSDGDIEFVELVDGADGGSDFGRAVAIDGSGAVTIGGNVSVVVDDDSDPLGWMRRYAPGGDEVWTYAYDDGATTHSTIDDLLVDEMGNVVATGYRWAYGDDSAHAVLMMLAP
jgi:cysteine-rich repeat protein